MTINFVSLAHRYYDALNAIDLATVETMLAVDAEYHSSGIGSLVGKPAIIAAMRTYFAEYQDQVAVVESSELLGSDVVRSHWRLKATAKSSGKPLVRQGTETITFNSQNLIRRVDVRDL